MTSAVPSSHASLPTGGPDDDLSVEEVALRLGLPVSMLVRRVEAGDVPARRVLGPRGVSYRLRPADLGVSFDPEEPETMNGNGASAPPDQAPDDAASPPAGPAPRPPTAGLAFRPPAAAGSPPAAPAPRPPMAGLVFRPPAAAAVATADPAGDAEQPPDTAAPPAASTPAPTVFPPAAASSGAAPAGAPPSVAPPPPGPLPQEQLAAIALDPRELVAGLLDRWEKTLEQRILAEQRQRFEAELDARQSHIKQLQLEIEQARAQHAAALAQREQAWAERERDLAERERLAAERAAGRRGLFRRR